MNVVYVFRLLNCSFSSPSLRFTKKILNYWCVLAAEVCVSLCCSVSWLSRSPGSLLFLHFLLLLRLLLGDFCGLLEWPWRMTAARLAAESRWTNGVSCPNGGKHGSWQSDHHGGRVQLQPHAGLHTLQHQPEPLPTSSRPHVSIHMHTHLLRVCELNQAGFIFFLSLNLEHIKHLKGDFTLHIFIFLAALGENRGWHFRSLLGHGLMQSPWLSRNLIGPKQESVRWPVAGKLSWSCTLKQLITSDVIIKCVASVSADLCFCSLCVSSGRDLELFLTPCGFSVRLSSFVLLLQWTNTFACIRTLSWFIYLSDQLLSVAAVWCGYSPRFSLAGRDVVTQQALPDTHTHTLWGDIKAELHHVCFACCFEHLEQDFY